MAEGTQAAQGAQAQQAQGEGAQPQAVSREEYDKLLERSRKWERQSKANAEKAKAYDELAAKSMTDAERAEAAEKRAEAAEAKVEEFERREERAGIVSEVASEKGVDAEMLARMVGDSREDIEANADFIAKRLKNAPIYPSVGDRGQQKAAPVTIDQIEAIKDPKKRVMERAKHIELYRK